MLHFSAPSKTDFTLQDPLKNPLVTVIACCYNHSAFLVESLESIRQQTYPHVQLIIIDDASHDDSDAIITNWIAEHRMPCTYRRHQTNKGICKTLNEALSHAKGKYVSFLATDDLLALDKLEHQVNIMETLPETVGVLYSNALQITEEGEEIGLLETPTASWPVEGDIFSQLIDRNCVPPMTALIRASCFKTVGLYDERLCFEDWDMSLRISQHYHFAYSPKIYAKRRVVSTSMTNTLLKGESPEFLRTLFRLNEKLLKSDKLASPQRSLVIQRLAWFAERMYQLEHECRAPLFKAFRADHRARTFVMALCSALGIRYSYFCKILERLASVKKTFRYNT